MIPMKLPPSALPLLLLLASPVVRGDERPNILLLMSDDHGWEETAYNGHPYLKTPVLDEMAASALRLDHFYAGHPNCSPTRAGFLTGRHPNRMGTFSPGWSFRPEEITMAHLLAAQGYRCGHFGKWHVGAVKRESPVSPLAMGFHENLSHDNFFELNPSLSRDGGPPEVFPGESSEILVEETIRFVERARGEGQPFLGVVWFGSPHEPYQALPGDLALYDELPAKYPDKMVSLTSNETGGPTRRPLGEVLRERYAEITAMDRAIGRLRSHLAESGLRENTLLLYCSDNGTSADGFLASPHRGMKSDIYEGGTRVPGLLEWPARFPEPQASALRVSTNDLMPTVAALAGAALPGRPIDGIDVLPLLEKGVETRPEPLFFWMAGSGMGRGDGARPYIDPELQRGTTPLAKLMGGVATRNFQNFHHPVVEEGDYLGRRSIIEGDWKLVVTESKGGTERRELFDLASDRGETRDLAKDEPARVESLAKRLREWQDSVLRSLTGADYAQ
jgi:arylsulfatase A-like enzyme